MKKLIVQVLVGLSVMTFLTACKKHVVQSDVHRWTSSEVAAPDSVEGQLRSQGKHWVKATGEITAGVYVQDILEGRLDQPKGRGAIGKVVSVGAGDNGGQVAVVDFGRGCSVGISLSELSLVNVVPN